MEILDIFLGFAVCTEHETEGWKLELREELRKSRDTFKGFATSENEDISCFAEGILESLEKA